MAVLHPNPTPHLPPLPPQPFNAEYTWFNTTDNLLIPDSSLTTLNSYKGGVYQQAVSSVTTTSKIPHACMRF